MTSTTPLYPRIARLFAAVPLLILPLLVAHPATAFYPPDGSKDDGMGGYENPSDGMCVIGVALDGTMLVDWSITNARDCVAWTKAADNSVDLAGLNTQAKCTDADAAGSDGYKHAWSTSLCVKDGAGLSRVDLDNTDAMCLSKGGTVVTTGRCIAYGWVYRNRKSDGSLPVTGTGIGTTDGIQLSDGVGFCYTSMRETASNADGGTYTSAANCPSVHNSPKICSGGSVPGIPCTADATCTGGGTCVANAADWTPCLSSSNGCQTQAAYDTGLGWSFSSSQCVYAYGVKGRLSGTVTNVVGTASSAGTLVDLSGITNQGDCLAAGYSWDAWLPTGPGQAVLEDNTGAYTGIPTANLLYNPNALDAVGEGGGDFYTGTGAICLKCHSDQSRSYQERNKPGYVKTRHKMAGDAVGKPFQPYFTAMGSDWGLQGVQCAMCHSTAKPAQDDLIQVNPAGAVGEGLPKSASGHNQTEYGTHLVDICYTCHGTAAVPESVNPASVIPVAAGEFDLTAKGLEPIANEFLNSPHALYTGTSSKVDVGNKNFYGSSFEGYVCRTAATQFRNNAAPGDSQANCLADSRGLTWYTTTNFGNYCYYNSTSCLAQPGAQWVPVSAPNTVYPWAVDAGGPQNLCVGIGIGSIITTVYRAGEAEKIHNLDSTVNEACTNAPDGSSTSGAGGFWVKDGESSPGVPTDTAQGNCMTCHDVHWAIADETAEAEPFRRECDTCHMNPGTSASDAPQINLATINHLASAGTPLENVATDPVEACETCHMPKSGGDESSRMHLWRISTDPDYHTMGATEVNLDVDGNAWVDIDHACGQCHGGGTVQDAEHTPTAPAIYRTAAQLATVAKGMHDASGVSYPVTFTTKVTGLKVDVKAYVTCGIPCPPFTYNWAWGDGSSNDELTPITDHTYAAAGKTKITLTVLLDGKIVGSVTRSVTPGSVVGNDTPPVASATCTFDVNTWTATVTDTSTDPDATPVQTVAVDWSDESGRSVGGAGAVLTHTYIAPGSYTLEFMAIDSALKASTIALVCTPPVAPAYFKITGTVFQSDGTTAVAGANVIVKQGRVRVARVQTAVDGTFTAGSLRPGPYKIKVRKSGFTFAIPAATKTVGPDGSVTILAVTP